MPGMMDTDPRPRLTDAVEAALAAETGDPAFAAEVHRRFCGFYGRLVLGCTEELDDLPDTAAVRAAVLEDTGEHIPGDPWEQLRAAVAAVFALQPSRRGPWPTASTTASRDDLGTAVTVQAMVFGNLDDRSGTGVLFTRDPAERRPGAATASTSRAARARTWCPAGSTPQPLATWPSASRGARRAARRRRSAWTPRAATRRTSSSPCERGELFLLQSRPGEAHRPRRGPASRSRPSTRA